MKSQREAIYMRICICKYIYICIAIHTYEFIHTNNSIELIAFVRDVRLETRFKKRKVAPLIDMLRFDEAPGEAQSNEKTER